MKIHHFTIPARDPQRVARVLAELLGAKVFPNAHPPGSLVVYAGDEDGTAIEVWPAATRGAPGQHEIGPRADLALPEAWPHHAYVSSEACTAEQILKVFAREGWKADKVTNGPPHASFSLVRGWIENQTTIEIVDREMREQYERFFRVMVNRPSPA